jgi:acetyltransferase
VPDIGKLLWPRSVAVIGASSDTKGLRGRILEIMRGHPFVGPVYPVSRSETVVQGLAAFRSVEALPAPADLAVLIIPAKFVPQELERCGAPASRRRSILSSGFAEEPGGAGARMQREISRSPALRHGGGGPNRRLRQHRGGAVRRTSARRWTRMRGRSCRRARGRGRCR